MADGSTKSLKDVEIDDEVVATDPATGETADEPVTLLQDNLDHAFVDLTVSSHGHTTTIHTTQEHPFWDEETGSGRMRVTSGPATSYAATPTQSSRSTDWSSP
jgi:hypothetical protein